MKRVVCLLLALCVILVTAVSASAVDYGCNVEPVSKAVFLKNLDTGAIVYDKNVDDRMYPASTTKIMTYVVVAANVSDFDRIDISGAITCDRNTTPKLVRFTLGDPDALEEDDNKITLTYTKAKHEEVKFIFYKKRFGSAKKSVTTGSSFESGYYEHAVVFECRKAP